MSRAKTLGTKGASNGDLQSELQFTLGIHLGMFVCGLLVHWTNTRLFC